MQTRSPSPHSILRRAGGKRKGRGRGHIYQIPPSSATTAASVRIYRAVRRRVYVLHVKKKKEEEE